MKSVIGYLRVSTDEQARTGYGLDAQRSAITLEAEQRGWSVQFIEDAGYSAKDLKRPGLQEALSLLSCGESSGLVAAKLDRLSRSVLDFSNLMSVADRERWELVVLDPRVDTTDIYGRAIVQIIAVFAELERGIIGQRVTEALAEAKKRGVRLGAPRRLDPATLHQVIDLRGEGLSLREIARRLTDESIPTALGARTWHPIQVWRALRSHQLDEEARLARESTHA